MPHSGRWQRSANQSSDPGASSSYWVIWHAGVGVARAPEPAVAGGVSVSTRVASEGEVR